MRTDVLQKRAAERVDDLIRTFPDCLEAFEKANKWPGPNLYFHRKTIAISRGSLHKADLLDDPLFFDMLYATLAAWGMHRLGDNKTKLLELNQIRESFAKQAEAIGQVESRSLAGMPGEDVEEVGTRIWEILAGLRVGIGSIKIVANTKALHHLLPNLVPPVDRRYTLRFFHKNTILAREEPLIFIDLYHALHRIMNARREDICRAVDDGRGYNTSITKVIDNAITGYMIRQDHLRRAERGQQENTRYARADLLIPESFAVGSEAFDDYGQSGLTHAEKIVRAVRSLVAQGSPTFSRKQVRDRAGIPAAIWDTSYSAMFQSMRDDHPGGAPPINKKYRGIFHRVAPGRYALTEAGTNLLFGGRQNP